MTKTVETVLAWGLFAAVYVLILAIVIAPDLFSADQPPVVTVAQADLAGALANGDLTPSWGQDPVLTGNRVVPQTASLGTTQP